MSRRHSLNLALSRHSSATLLCPSHVHSVYPESYRGFCVHDDILRTEAESDSFKGGKILPRILWSAWLVLFLLAACGTSAAPRPADTQTEATAGLPAVTVYKSPT